MLLSESEQQAEQERREATGRPVNRTPLPDRHFTAQREININNNLSPSSSSSSSSHSIYSLSSSSSSSNSFSSSTLSILSQVELESSSRLSLARKSLSQKLPKQQLNVEESSPPPPPSSRSMATKRKKINEKNVYDVIKLSSSKSSSLNNELRKRLRNGPKCNYAGMDRSKPLFKRKKKNRAQQ